MKLFMAVYLEGRRGSFEAGREIPELYREVFEPLRVGDEPMLRSVCDEISPEAARVVMETRKDAADILAKEIAAFLVDEMKKHDTFNGYPTR